MRTIPSGLYFLRNWDFGCSCQPPSSKELYESGMETISSDTACYPAKLVHGHIKWLVDQGVKWIFYPGVDYERIEDPTAPNHYNCPIVATYPEVIAGNMDDVFEENGVTFSHPFIPYDNDEFLAREMYKVPKTERRLLEPPWNTL